MLSREKQLASCLWLETWTETSRANLNGCPSTSCKGIKGTLCYDDWCYHMVTCTNLFVCASNVFFCGFSSWSHSAYKQCIAFTLVVWSHMSYGHSLCQETSMHCLSVASVRTKYSEHSWKLMAGTVKKDLSLPLTVCYFSDLDEWTQFITMWRTTIWQSFPHSQPTFLVAINCAHASNWFTHLQQRQQIDQNDNSVRTVWSQRTCIGFILSNILLPVFSLVLRLSPHPNKIKGED